MATTPTPFDRSKVKRCGTTQYMAKLKVVKPNLAKELADYEILMQEFIARNYPSSPNKGTTFYG